MSDIDRIAVSNELFEISERFMLEATLWSEPGCRVELERVARHLSVIARRTLTAGDIEVADAYARSADLLMRNIEGTRRFFRTVLTPPSVRTPRFT